MSPLAVLFLLCSLKRVHSCRNPRVQHPLRNLLRSLIASSEDPMLSGNMSVFKKIMIFSCLCFNFFKSVGWLFLIFEICFCYRRTLMLLLAVSWKTLGSVKGNLLQHLPSTNVFSTGNLLKLKGLVYLIVSSRWLVQPLR